MKLKTVTLVAMAAIAGGTAGIIGGLQIVENLPDHQPVTQNVRTVGDVSTASETPTESATPTPTESVSASPEGDDGSLGGPVYNPSHTETPTYIIRAPQKAAVVQETPTDAATTDSPSASDNWDPDGNGNATPGSRTKGPDGRDIVEPAPASSVPVAPSTSTEGQ
jgi:hypothetical protein